MNKFSRGINKLRAIARPPRKLLFDSIPKCAGTSIATVLEGTYRTRRTFETDWQNPRASIDLFRSLPVEQRHRFDLVHGHEAHQIRYEFVPDAVRMTILRDPVDRIISHYYYVLRTPVHYLHDRVAKEGLSLRDYVASGLSGELRNYYVSHFLEEPAEELEKSPESSVSRAVDLLTKEYAILGFLEDMPATFADLTREARLPSSMKLQELNVTSNRPAKNAVDDRTLETIKEKNSLDIQLYRIMRDRAARR